MSNETHRETLQAQGDFPFVFRIEKAVPLEHDGDMIIRGVASTINVDHDHERMAKDALLSMAEKINFESVPLRLEHNHSENAVIGSVDKAWVDERNQMWIEAKLDKEHPVAPMLYTSLKEGVRMGLSVGGRVKNATKEFVESVGQMVKTFYDVVLDEVSVTYKPANYDSWLVTKSISPDKKEWSLVKRQFLMENPSLDYLQAFAKSVPDKAWRRIESPITNKDKHMATTDTTTDDTTKAVGSSSSETTDETTKSISRAEFRALQNSVEGLAKSMESFVTIVKAGALSISARDQQNSDTEKPDPEVSAKKTSASTGGDTTEADEQRNPPKKKPSFNPDPQAKAQSSTTSDTTKTSTVPVRERTGQTTDDTANGTDTTGERSRAKTSTTTGTTTEETTKMSTTTDDTDTTTKAIERAAKAIQAAVRAMKAGSTAETEETVGNPTTTKAGRTSSSSTSSTDTETTKASGTGTDTDTETTTKSRSDVASIDQFSAMVSQFADTIVEKNRSRGVRYSTDEYRMIANMIQSDPVFQKSIKEMMKEPGAKRSVVRGVPMMITKEGRSYSLAAKSLDMDESVEKSEKPKNFRAEWKKQYSSTSVDSE